MEALAAVGLAGNIVQFIDFTYKLFDHATSIYYSRSGASSGAQDLESITQNLRDLSAKLSSLHCYPGLATTPSANPELAALSKLAKDCEAVATELLSALQGLKASNPGSKWSSFRAALASTWKEKRVSALETRLSIYRSQLVLQLQVMQSNANSKVLHLLDELSNRSLRTSSVLHDQVSSLRKELQVGIETLRSHLVDQNQTQHTRPVDIANLAGSLSHAEISGTVINRALAVLESLTYDQMDFRHSAIHKAYPRTFAWAFAHPISEWLASPELLFWISGKPGSGKSTLMKYLADHPETLVKLREWANPDNLVIASYFFWINGTEMQRSQEGLLQSLLYDILRQRPDLIEGVLNFQGQPLDMRPRQNIARMTWTRSGLLEALRRLSKLDSTGTRFCVFVDGLDEYQGDHDELVEVIRHLCTANIKICVASRPWNVFEESFGKSNRFKIYMQDLNKSDIAFYVDDKIRKRLEVQHTNVDELKGIILEIILKSQGVFLWVYLVVRSLIEGLRNQDRLSQLRKRVDDFPSDLDEFFRHIFLSLDSTYRMQTAHMFQVALAASQSMPVLCYWFLDEIEDQPNMALMMPIKALSCDEYMRIIEQMKVRLNGRCKGLLEVVGGQLGCQVDFLHRTVKDFFTTTEMQLTFRNCQDKAFDVNFYICRAALATSKAVADAPYDTLGVAVMDSFIIPFMVAAKRYECEHQKTLAEYIEQIKPVFEAAEKSRRPRDLQSWELSSHWELVVRADLLVYTRHKLDAGLSLADKNSLQSLWSDSRPHNFLQVSPEMVLLLLSSHTIVTLSAGVQQSLTQSDFWKGREQSKENIFTSLMEMCSVGPVQMKNKRFASKGLCDLLESRLSKREIEELVETSLKHESSQKHKSVQENKNNNSGEEIVQLKTKRRSLFRKLFR